MKNLILYSVNPGIIHINKSLLIYYFYCTGITPSITMDREEFRIHGKEMIDYICKYRETMKDMRVTPLVDPGYMRKEIPSAAPQDPETFDQILADIDTKIMPGMTHWGHPRFHAYFPAGNSFASLLGGMMCDAFGCIGFSWVSI